MLRPVVTLYYKHTFNNKTSTVNDKYSNINNIHGTKMEMQLQYLKLPKKCCQFPIQSHFISNIMNDTHVLSYRINSQQIIQRKNIILDHTKWGQHLCCAHGFTAHSLLHPAKPHSASCITDHLVLIFPAVRTTNTVGMSHLVLLITTHTRCIWR